MANRTLMLASASAAAVAAVALLGLASFAQAEVPAHGKMVNCYVGTWAFYRPGYGKYDVEDLDPFLCTHGFYGFADMDNITWEIYPYDPWYDLAPEDCEPGYCNYDSYRRFVNLKNINPDFVPILSIGGWNAGSGKYGIMSRDPAKREKFINSVIPFALKYGFEGIDFDWEYPGSRNGSLPEDKQHFTELVQEMAARTQAEGLLFSSAMSPGKPTIDDAYELDELIKYFDFINIMCYDYHGCWHPEFTGHNAPLMGLDYENVEGHPGIWFNVWYTMTYYMELGVPADMMVMGMPSYGRGFKNVETSEDGLYCRADGCIPMGPYTRQKGIWGYNEIYLAKTNDTLWNLPDGVPGAWVDTRDKCVNAPYMTNAHYWIGYDDPESIAKKVQFANFIDTAGVMIWSADTDDFSGLSGPVYPILQTMNDELLSGAQFDPTQDDCSVGSAPWCPIGPKPSTTTEEPTTMTTDGGSGGSTTDGSGGPEGACEYHNQFLPWPGSCHDYFRCVEISDGVFEVDGPYTCGDDVFNPDSNSCVDANLPGNENICNE